MVCQVCGRSVEEGDRFCTGCGVSLAERPPVEAADADTPEPDTPEPHTAEPDTAVSDSTGATDPAAGDEPGRTSGDERPDARDGDGAADDAPADERPPASDRSDGDADDETAGLDTAALSRVVASAGRATEMGSRSPAAPAATSDVRADDVAPTELVELVDDDGWGDDDPVWAPTAPTTTHATATRTADLPATEPITEVWSRGAGEGAAVSRSTTSLGGDVEAPAATAQMPVVAPAVDPGGHRLRFGAVTIFGLISGAITLAALFTTLIAVESDVRLEPIDDQPAAFRTGTWLIDDLADNLSIAGLIAVLAIVVGAIAAIFRWRWGSGLAAGAGLATAGIAMLTIGLAQIPIDAAEEFAGIPNEQVFTLTITRDIGYWLLVAAGAIGIVVFFAAVNDATGDHRPGLNPWTAALGGLATVVAVGGPLIPENLADFSDNWLVSDGPGEPPAMLLVGRLVQLGLVLVAGLVGFLSVRRWGLGVAIGGALPTLWLAVSTLFEITDDPAGPGWRNPGADDTHLHGVTIIGISALLAMWILAAVAAYDQSARR